MYFSFTKNTYVFSKYNFFTKLDKNYIFLDRFILSLFLQIIRRISNPSIPFKNSYSSHEKLKEIFNIGIENFFYKFLLTLIRG